MKIKNIAAVLLLIWTCGFSSVVSAAEIQTVQLTEENQLVYTKDKTELAGAFDGMAPGDSRTVVIKIENQNSHKASFFISQKTTDALEEAGKASGGAYEFQVEIGNDTNRTSLLDADAGGYAENVASAEGLVEITELNEYRYMTALNPGESTDVYVTLTLDGEGMDSADGIDYSRAAGAMEFEFRAYYADDRKPVVITNYVTEYGEDNVVTKVVKKVIPKTVTEQLVPLANGVRTGDPLTVTLTLDGEGMDSANGIDYSRAAGAMEFEFRAYYADDRKPVVITNYVTEYGEDNVVTKVVKKVIPKTVTEQLVPLANGVRTGDPLTVTVSAGVLVAGIVIVSIAVKKRKVERKS